MEIIEIINIILAAISPVFGFVFFNWDKILNMKNYLKEKNIMKVIAIIDNKYIDINTKEIAKEVLKDMNFSYTLNLMGKNITNIAFVKQALDLIKKSNGLITIEDFRNAQDMVIIKDDELKTKNVILQSIPLIFVFYPFVVIFYRIICDEIPIETLKSVFTWEVISLIVLYALVIIWNFYRMAKIYKSTKKIKEALA